MPKVTKPGTTRLKTLILTLIYPNRASYYDDWRDAFLDSPAFDCDVASISLFRHRLGQSQQPAYAFRKSAVPELLSVAGSQHRSVSLITASFCTGDHSTHVDSITVSGIAGTDRVVHQTRQK